MVAGTAAADTIPPHPARRLIAPRSQAGRRRVTRDGGFWVASSRAPSGTTSPPGSRPWCGPTLMREVLTTRAGCRGPGRSRPRWPRPWARPSTPAPSRPPTSGPAPVTRRSGSSIRGERVCRTGNKRLEHAMFLSAFASLTDPVSRAYYQRKRDQGKRLGPGPARPGPPPHPHPARHDPQPATKLPTAA